MAKKTETKFKVANTEIIIGQTYEVVPKKDANAPSGFQQYGTTKLLMEGIKEVRGISYNETMQVWDTGFEYDSFCNKHIKEAEKKALVDTYNKLVKEPYEKFRRISADHVNDDFWKSYMYEIWTGKTFDTTNAKDLFDLFHALKQGKLCEVGEKDPELQRAAKYCIKNREKVISLQEQKAENKMEAYFKFSTSLDALKSEDDDLYTILEWLQIPNVRGADKQTLKRTVLKMFENEKLGNDNVERFLGAYDYIKSKEGKEEMELFSMVSKLRYKQKLEFKRQQFYLDGTLLGNSIKAAAKSALLNPECRS
jgi:hypothetical protein